MYSRPRNYFTDEMPEQTNFKTWRHFQCSLRSTTLSSWASKISSFTLIAIQEITASSSCIHTWKLLRRLNRCLLLFLEPCFRFGSPNVSLLFLSQPHQMNGILLSDDYPTPLVFSEMNVDRSSGMSYRGRIWNKFPRLNKKATNQQPQNKKPVRSKLNLYKRRKRFW